MFGKIDIKYILLLLFAGILLRAFFFNSQVWLGSDVTRDISISLEALKRLELPLTGSFSSAGPFVFGPTLYWLYMMAFVIFPFSILTPWYLAFITSVLSILLFFQISKKLGSTFFVFLVMIMVLFSPQLILSSASPTQHSFVLIFTLLTLYFLLKFYEKGNQINALIAGISLGVAINMHYQAVNLIVVPLIILFFTKSKLKYRLLGVLVTYLGIAVALLPLTWWDSGQNFANWRNLFDYLLIGQGRVYVPNSWKIYALNYLPNYISYVTGLPKVVSFLVLLAGALFAVVNFVKERRFSFLTLTSFVFLLLIFAGRYYRGERFAGYTVYLIPLIILFSASTIEKLFIERLQGSNKLMGLWIILILILMTTFFQIKDHTKANTSLGETLNAISTLPGSEVGQKYKVLNLAGTNPDASYAMAVILKSKNLYDVNSQTSVGFCTGCPESSSEIGKLLGTSYFIVNSEKGDSKWQIVSQAGIYDSTIGWLNMHNLTSTFYLDKYIGEKISKN